MSFDDVNLLVTGQTARLPWPWIGAYLLSIFLVDQLL